MTAVLGTFADFKTVKTRSVCQLIIEVPIESADHALAVLGGVPQAKAEQWVGIAPVTAPEQSQTAEEAERLLLATETPEEPERSLSEADRKLIRQAGMLPKNANFRQWLWDFAGPPGTVGAYDEAGAEAAVRRLCGVKSRSLIRFNEPSGKIMNDLCHDFFNAQRGETPEELARQAAGGPR